MKSTRSAGETFRLPWQVTTSQLGWQLVFLQRDSWHQTQPGPSVRAETSLFIFWLRSLFSDFPLITGAAEGKRTCSQCSVAGLVPVERSGVLTGAFVVVLWGHINIYIHIYV